jgi:hypothetical protein
MGLKLKVVLIAIMVSSLISAAEAAWQGPTEILSGKWGKGIGQFGLDEGDSGDQSPMLKAITPDGKIVISDTVNKKQLVFNSDGSFNKEVKWVIESKSGGSTTYDIPEYSFGYVLGYSSDGNVYSSVGSTYFFKSYTGQTIKTSTTKPPELGDVSEKALGNGQYKITVTYPDRVWSIIGRGIAPPYMRDMNGNLYSTGVKQAIRWNFCGKELARLTMPNNNIQTEDHGEQIAPTVTVLEGYGSPVVAPNGDVYTWKRTPDKYSIVKWTWVDDPGSNDDCPAEKAKDNKAAGKK